MPKFSRTLYLEIFSPFTIIGTILFGLLYYLLSILLLNYKLLYSLLSNHYSFSFFISLISSFFIGTWTSMNTIEFILLLLNTILVGMNLYFALRTLFIIEHRGKVRLSVGGATIVSLISTGCASCGLSLISVLGLSASLSFLPFHGTEIHIISLLLLITSLVYMLKQLHNAKYCKIPRQNESRKR